MTDKPVVPRELATRAVHEAITWYLSIEQADHVDVWRELRGERDIPAWMKDAGVD